MGFPFRSRRPLWSRLRNRHPLASVLSASELEQVFQQERARVDRNHQVFSMVVFLPISGADEGRLVKTLKERMRFYDTLGYLDTRRLALLLPETDSDGAWTFADDALGRLSEQGLVYECEVYCYPAEWTNEKGETRRRSRSPRAVGGDGGGGESAADSTGTEGPVLRMLGAAEPATATAVRRVTSQSLQHIRSEIGERPVQDLAPAFVQPLDPRRRLIDIAVSGTLLVLLLPVFVVAAVLIKLDTRGPLFFVQKRAGLGGRPFDFYKFRSMYVDAEKRRKALLAKNQHKGKPIFKLKNDPRITRVGRLLRRTSIDELPQLLNVLKGDMTLIGPRPPRLDEVEQYEPWQRRRLEIMGGLTCIWQVSGRSEVGFEDWVRMDIQYQERRSVGFDLKLLFKTVGAVFSGRGAY